MTADNRKVIWITGASMGIGAAIARRAAQEGWAVAVSARSRDKLAALEAEHDAIHAYPLDVLDRGENAAVLDRIEADLGPVDIAVLNAGTHADMPAAEFDAAAAARIFDLNLTGLANGIEPVVQRFLARGRGRLALTASVAGYRGLPRAAAYCASKAGVIAMAESLAAEIGPRGVTVQVICPGFVRTPLTDKNEFPMPFLMEPEDAAERVVKGLQGTSFEIAFPRRFVWQLKLLRLLPAALYFRLIRKATGL
ncbi:SDR family NAD(P)-dependent oxidoreductase [Pacificispira sp.]|uniref:SDR family NAD(P)-dependent oxidoreductase n=1 Tax=Pacificispira sp. TaxID=2888761 RepID=UPI003BAC5010